MALRHIAYAQYFPGVGENRLYSRWGHPISTFIWLSDPKGDIIFPIWQAALPISGTPISFLLLHFASVCLVSFLFLPQRITSSPASPLPLLVSTFYSLWTGHGYIRPFSPHMCTTFCIKLSPFCLFYLTGEFFSFFPEKKWIYYRYFIVQTM